MPRLRLTDIVIQALKPPVEGQVTYFDDRLPGFGCRVSVAGTKSWVVMVGRERRLITLARYPNMTLRDARIAAKAAMADPPKPKNGTMTVGAAYDLFIAASKAKHRPRTTHDYEYNLSRFLLKKFRHKELSAVTTEGVMEIVDALPHLPTTQLKTFLISETFLRFCVRRKLLAISPLHGLPPPSKVRTRDRVLTEKEIKKVWKAAEIHPYLFAKLIQLCLLTGQRRGELNKLKWEYIDRAENTITIPASLAKNAKEHTFPFGPMTAAILDSIPKSSEYLFTGRLQGHFEGFSRAKLQIRLQ